MEINCWCAFLPYFIRLFLFEHAINPIKFKFPWRFAVDIDREQKVDIGVLVNG